MSKRTFARQTGKLAAIGDPKNVAGGSGSQGDPVYARLDPFFVGEGKDGIPRILK
jgi:hypothetical protein